MEDPKEHFIQEATRRLPENAELIAAARSLLGGIAQGNEESLTHAVSTWQATDESQFPALRRWVVYGTLAVVSAGIAGDTVKMCWGYENAISVMDGSTFVDVFHNVPTVTEEQVATTLTDDQKLLVFGDRLEKSNAKRMRALWDTDPRNPTYFAEYTAAYLEQYGKLPEGFLDIAKSIDPDNAWFTHVAAGVRAKNAVKSREQSRVARAGNEPLEWDVIDAVALNESLYILRQARTQPRCENPRAVLYREQMKLLPMDTPVEVIFSLGYSHGKTSSTELVLRDLGNTLAAKAWLCGESGDIVGFVEVDKNTNLFLRQRTESPVEGILGELITRVTAFGTISNRASAASKLGLLEEVEQLAAPLQEVNRLKKRATGPLPHNPNAELAENHGGRIAGLISAFNLRQLENPPGLTVKDVEPGRLMDHATLSWTGAWAAWAMLIFGMAICALVRFTGRDLTKHLAKRLEFVLRPRDWLVVGILGVILPAAWFVAINRCTTLGGRNLSMGRNELTFPYLEGSILLGLAQFIALAVSILFFSGWLACWRVGRRFEFLGLETRPPWSIAVAALCSAVFIPTSGWAVTNSSLAVLYLAHGLVGIAVLGLIAFGFRCLSGRSIDMIRNQVAMRMMVPICAAAALLLVSSVPFFKAEAYRWSSKNNLINPSRHHMASSDFEHRLAEQMRKELRGVLGFTP